MASKESDIAGDGTTMVTGACPTVIGKAVAAGMNRTDLKRSIVLDHAVAEAASDLKLPLQEVQDLGGDRRTISANGEKMIGDSSGRRCRGSAMRA